MERQPIIIVHLFTLFSLLEHFGKLCANLLTNQQRLLIKLLVVEVLGDLRAHLEYLQVRRLVLVMVVVALVLIVAHEHIEESLRVLLEVEAE